MLLVVPQAHIMEVLLEVITVVHMEVHIMNFLRNNVVRQLDSAVSYHLTHSLTLIRKVDVEETSTQQSSCYLYYSL